jgi:hypothetical protein
MREIDMKDENDRQGNPRRGFLKQVAASGSLPFVPRWVGGVRCGIANPAGAAPETKPAIDEAAGYLSLSPEEAAFTEAMVNVIT